jgi:metallophosphoesterase superfamily enzyme
VIADLHLGYDQARRRTGEAIPTSSIEDALTDLAALRAALPVRKLVIAGDLIENQAGNTQLGRFLEWLRANGLELAAVVPGNHDRGGAFESLPVFPDGVVLGEWRVLHGDGPLPEGPLVLGHFHPCLRWGRINAPCYLAGRGQLLLPAFSLDARGVNVLGPREWQADHCAVIAGREVLDLGPVRAITRRQNAAGSGWTRSPRAHGRGKRGYQ